MSEYDFNDLLAAWLDTIEVGDHINYIRNEDGKFEWIDFCTWTNEDFDAFVKEKMKKQVEGDSWRHRAEYYQELNVKYVKIFRKIRDMLLKLELDSGWDEKENELEEIS